MPEHIACDSIKVPRSSRQRREANPKDGGLQESIARNGVLVPIILRRDLTLVAGERRLTAALALGHPTIPAIFTDQLDQIELKIIELEENLRRQSLGWQDECRAVWEIHQLFTESSAEWTLAQTAHDLNLSRHVVSMQVKVARALVAGNPKILKSTSYRGAYDVLTAQDQRTLQDTILEADLDEILAPKAEAKTPSELQRLPIGEESSVPRAGLEEDLSQLAQSSTAGVARTLASQIDPSPPETSQVPVLHQSFLEWAPTFTGRPFNLLHCDFPYGVDLFSGGKNSAFEFERHQDYKDQSDIFWDLVGCLSTNFDRLVAPSAHIIFWFPMDKYVELFKLLSQCDLEVQPYPLYWHKSDNAGIMADPKRQPRRVVETALLCSRGDRPLVTAVSNFYSAPIGPSKKHHPSPKPVPMLEHFLSMVVDENTRLLDPTCGGGGALVSAETLGAKEVLGLEVDSEHHQSAVRHLQSTRTLRSLAGKDQR